VAQLLISVRSASEAILAVGAGAAIIDVKEPAGGSLGRADCSVWSEVRSALPPKFPLSVALGELNEWLMPGQPVLPDQAWAGISFCKLGLAGAGSDWRSSWRELRSSLGGESGPAWIAVAYADWQAASAPDPDAVLEAACESPRIVGVLVDTWAKTQPLRFDAGWISRASRVRDSGRMLAVAGGLDIASIAALDHAAPDVVAVRGAACAQGDRRAAIDPGRVADLARVVASLPVRPRQGRVEFGIASELVGCAASGG